MSALLDIEDGRGSFVKLVGNPVGLSEGLEKNSWRHGDLEPRSIADVVTNPERAVAEHNVGRNGNVKASVEPIRHNAPSTPRATEQAISAASGVSGSLTDGFMKAPRHG